MLRRHRVHPHALEVVRVDHRHEARDRAPRARDDDLLARQRGIEELGELDLGLANVHLHRRLRWPTRRWQIDIRRATLGSSRNSSQVRAYDHHTSAGL
jgi:hypothetical protein